MFSLYALEPKSTVGQNLSAVRYIGITTKGLDRRLYNHVKDAQSSKKSYKCNWIRSLWNKGDDVVISLIKTCESIEELKKEEILFISLVRNTLPDWKLTNVSAGGGGRYDLTCSAETRARIGAAQIGEKNHRYGRTHTQDAKDKIGAATSKRLKGVPLSANRKRKIIESRIRKPVVDNFGNVWESIHKAAAILGLCPGHIIKVCKKERKSTGGFTFQYLEINA